MKIISAVQQAKRVYKPKTSLNELKKRMLEKGEKVTVINPSTNSKLTMIYTDYGKHHKYILNSVKKRIKEIDILFNNATGVQERMLISKSYSRIIYLGNLLTYRPSKLDEVIQAEKFAKSLGVNAKYGDNMAIAKLTNDALQDFVKEGYTLPKEISASTLYGLLYPESYAVSLGYKDTILINSRTNWDYIQDTIKKEYDSGLYSTDNPKHILYHEFAHSLHRKKNPDRIFKKFTINELITTGFVSSRAAFNANEFIAETFSGILSGKKYYKEILEMYKQLGGPEVKPLNSSR